MASRAQSNSIWSTGNDSSIEDLLSSSNYSLSNSQPFNIENPKANLGRKSILENSEAIHSKSLYLSSISLEDHRLPTSSIPNTNLSPLNPSKLHKLQPQTYTNLSNSLPKAGYLSLLMTDSNPSTSNQSDQPFNLTQSASESSRLLENYISTDISALPNLNNIPPKLSSSTLASENKSILQKSLQKSPQNSSQNSSTQYFSNNYDTISRTDLASSDNHPEFFTLNRFKRKTAVFFNLLQSPIQYLPAVFLGLIFNLLDGISYGLITFPLSIPEYEHMGPVGLSMFFVSTIVCQVVLSSGFSAFRGANGLMMIEVIPFLYEMCNIILNTVGRNNKDRVIATTLMAYALGSIMTGSVFLILGAFKIGKLVDFFPRHILVGCIGGVGYFLVQTGFEVMSSIPFSFSLSVILQYLQPDKLVLWGSALLSAIFLRVLNLKFKGPMLVPFYCLLIPICFYLFVFAYKIPIDKLRADGWVFPLAKSDVPFYYYLTLFDLSNTDWVAIWKTVPTMIGLSFFGILHVPINVPALAVSISMNKLDTDRELVAHGISNIISGFLGSFQNYLVYSNSVLFYKSGGDSRLAGILLALVTVVIMISGPSILGYIPTIVVGMLIFHLGFELLKEALFDTWGVVNNIEYITISAIVLTMALVGFNEGIILGIVLACVFFILIYSNRSVIWKSCTGLSARSTVRRLYKHKIYLDQVVQQIHVMRLQGFMFFGTINFVEDSILLLLNKRQWEDNPIRFLIIDFAFVTGMDFSAAEAFIRLKRILTQKQIHLVMCGVSNNSEVSKALISSGLWVNDSSTQHNLAETYENNSQELNYLHVFSGLNAALEWCENFLLEYYIAFTNLNRKSESIINKPIDTKKQNKKPSDLISSELYSSSPRLTMLTRASKIISEPSQQSTTSATSSSETQSIPNNLHYAINLLSLALHKDDHPLPLEKFSFLVPYLTELCLTPGEYLWRKNDSPKGLYLVKSGLLSASITSFSSTPIFTNERPEIDNSTDENAFESIISGTLFGEIQLLTGKSYNNNVIARTNVELYFLSRENFEQLSKTESAKVLEFVRLLLVYTDQYISSVSSFCY
ncbi:hypothetical protein BB561_006339 [Smittium simulii]|uniref:STAS domain-containing protein n=1 Tax=Smittium simulii TaxID=133385 RepID=A0A2T9Y534_9FUNG|nr:hypothetical protein BB561_006339 [Smittium simulii]